MSQSITLLGGTGSIGDTTLALIAAHPDKFRLKAVTAQENVNKLIQICQQFKPDFAAIGNADKLDSLRTALDGLNINVAGGAEGLLEAARQPSDRCMAAIVGFAGLAPTLEAVRSSKIIMLANKECLVSAGDVFMRRAAKADCTVLPVDSEHNALYQLLQGQDLDAVEKFILTASGGPFRDFTKTQLEKVTPDMAMQHPVWAMGAKISIDSATLMNKGLELIEASYLFPVSKDKFDAVIHPQSIIHGMVFMNDGAVLAQMGLPDMRQPISYCMGWPQRVASQDKRLTFDDMNQLGFESPDENNFICLKLAKQALRAGGLFPTILNAANEVAVDAFRREKIGFMDIGYRVADVLEKATELGLAPRNGTRDNLDDVLACDALTRVKLHERL